MSLISPGSNDGLAVGLFVSAGFAAAVPSDAGGLFESSSSSLLSRNDRSTVFLLNIDGLAVGVDPPLSPVDGSITLSPKLRMLFTSISTVSTVVF